MESKILAWCREQRLFEPGAEVCCAVSGAEYFARGGVAILRKTGIVTDLVFGSETGETAALLEQADFLLHEPEDFRALLRKYTAEGLTFPQARTRAATECSAHISLSQTANDVLGTEYVKNLLAAGSSGKPALSCHPIPRITADSATKLRKDMQVELKKIQKQTGITFVFVTHDQEEALSMSDTVVVMSEGKIHQIGTPVDIYNEPQNAFVADFIGESNILDGVMLEDYKVTFSGQTFQCLDKDFAKNEADLSDIVAIDFAYRALRRSWHPTSGCGSQREIESKWTAEWYQMVADEAHCAHQEYLRSSDS